MRFDREKYINLILYILTQCYNKPGFGKTVLCSTLYFIDFGYYELYGQMLTNETYIKSKNGIKPKHFEKISQDLISKKQLHLRKEAYYNRTIHRYYPLIIPNLLFTSKEMELIDYAIKNLTNNNASTITRYAIKDPPIHVADIGDIINSIYVFSRNNEYSLIHKYL